MKREYRRPELVEYGRMDELTLGQTGNSPDMIFWNGQWIGPANNNCNPNVSTPNVSCS